MKGPRGKTQFELLTPRPAQTQFELLTPRGKTQFELLTPRYHEVSRDAMKAMNVALGRCGRGVGFLALVFAALDLVVFSMNLRAGAPASQTVLPALLLFAAILPATVTAVAGTRFQSECGRLSERSAVMVIRLRQLQSEGEALLGRMEPDSRQDRHHDMGSWTTEALDFVETAAETMAEEVSEWSVVYSKELQSVF